MGNCFICMRCNKQKRRTSYQNIEGADFEHRSADDNHVLIKNRQIKNSPKSDNPDGSTDTSSDDPDTDGNPQSSSRSGIPTLRGGGKRTRKSSSNNKVNTPIIKDDELNQNSSSQNIRNGSSSPPNNEREDKYVKHLVKEIGAEHYAVVQKNGRKLYILKQSGGSSYLFLGRKPEM